MDTLTRRINRAMPQIDRANAQLDAADKALAHAVDDLDVYLRTDNQPK